MTLALSYAVRSDVGLLQEGNEDSAYAGPDLLGALADAVATANLRLQELILSDPSIDGMGTTLTALLWWEGFAALCHIGNSRAYLLRDGQLVQLTHDHTLVQSLADEGRITEDEVATHPERGRLLRRGRRPRLERQPRPPDLATCVRRRRRARRAG
jgi:PPM family protein phosphatase